MTTDLASKIQKEPSLRPLVDDRYVVFASRSFRDEDHWHSVLRLVEGDSLSDLLEARGPATPATAVRHGVRLAEAAMALCAIGIVHTDVKSDNVLVNPAGESVLIDGTCFEKIGRRADVSLGTKPYACPELTQRAVLTAGTDVFSIGAVMCELLLGPVEFNTVSASWDADLCRGRRPDVSKATRLCPSLAPILGKCMEPRVDRRYASPEALLRDLRPWHEIRTCPPVRFVALWDAHGRVFAFRGGRSVVGRSQIDPRNMRLSEKHFELDVKRKALRVRDKGSLNGTRVNAKPIGSRWVELREGDVLAAADVELTVKVA